MKSDHQDAPRSGRARPLAVALTVLVSVVVLAVAGFVIWTRVSGYGAEPQAAALAASSTTQRGWYVFEPAAPADTAFIFYPGGLVEPSAYAPLMNQVADKGVMTVIVPMPLDLAIFGVDSAADVVAAYPNIKHWIIGGHSLGGSMAAEYVKGAPDSVDGLVFLASYSAESTDLSDAPFAVLSMYGTKDGKPAAEFEASADRLPADTVMRPIEGGNHAQFGDYGPQRGDGTATISRADQQRQAATAIVEFANSLK